MGMGIYSYALSHECCRIVKTLPLLLCWHESRVVFAERLVREMGSGMDPVAGPAERTGGKLTMKLDC
jgi:hypothetical protein